MKTTQCSLRRSLFAVAALALLGASASAEATASGAVLTVLGSESTDLMQIRFVSTPGQVEVFGVPGTPDGTSFTGITRLELRSFGGFDNIHVQSFSVAVPQLDIDTGTDNSEVLLDIKVPTTAALVMAHVDVRGGALDDKVDLRIDSDAEQFQLAWKVTAGEGKNETLVGFLSDQASTWSTLSGKYFGGALDDKLTLTVVTESPTLNINLDGSTGAGPDEVVLSADAAAGSVARGNIRLRMGDGLDKASLAFTQAALAIVRGVIDTGAGDDAIELSTADDLGGSVRLVSGAGHDRVAVDVNGALISGSMPNVRCGEGDDTESFIVHGGLFGSPFSDGGPGFDVFSGAGAAVNFEVVN